MKKNLKKAFLVLAILSALYFLLAPRATTYYERKPANTPNAETEKSEEAIKKDERAERIDRFFTEHGMPLAGYGRKFIEEADKNGIDWRLLPAIAIRESSGGKQACGNNPFGWASCRRDFDSIEEAIEYVTWNLGGHNPNTATYYSGDTRAKLQSYNGTVIPTYPEEVLALMEKF